MISSFLSSLFGKIAAATAAIAVAATVTATGNLPAPAQQGVSEALSKVGIHVPAGRIADVAEEATEVDATASSEPTAPVLPEQASDTAKAVTAVVFGSVLEGRAFGEAVSAAARSGKGSQRSNPATPALSAVPAVPGKPTIPAIPATPAVPPDPH